MIRLLVIWNVVITALLAVLLLGNRYGSSNKRPLQTGVPQSDVLRVRRVELVDQEGHLTAVLGQDSEGLAGGLSLLDPNGRRAVTLGLNDRGYGTLYFQSKDTIGKVAVGYLWGSDTPIPLTKEDPLAGWGIRVARPNGKAEVLGAQVDGRPITMVP